MRSKNLLGALLLCVCALAQAQTQPQRPRHRPAKKELVQKLLALQQPGIENAARSIVERPAAQMMQEAGRVLQTQFPADKREAIGKTIEADAKRYVDEALPPVRERALKLAPTTLGAVLEEKFTEDELKQLDRLVRIAGEQEIPAGQRRDAEQLHAKAGGRSAAADRAQAADAGAEGARRTGCPSRRCTRRRTDGCTACRRQAAGPASEQVE